MHERRAHGGVAAHAADGHRGCAAARVASPRLDGQNCAALSEPEHRFGFVAVCGRPNVGKSTLLNALVGEPIAVATRHPQTTREAMFGIWNPPGAQAVLVDTPGIHRARSALNRFMVSQAIAASREVDLVLLLADVPVIADLAHAQRWEPGPVATEGLTALAALSRPILLVLTKVDRLREPAHLLPVVARWSALHPFVAVVPTSATTGEGLAALQAEIVGRLPPGPPQFEPDQLSDRPMRWHASELVRAELFEHLGDELPYSCAVVIEAYHEGKQRDRVEATIYVERDSQRPIVIGKGARVVKAISMAARARISALTGRPCDLRVRVDVSADWTKDPERMARLGYAALATDVPIFEEAP